MATPTIDETKFNPTARIGRISNFPDDGIAIYVNRKISPAGLPMSIVFFTYHELIKWANSLNRGKTYDAGGERCYNNGIWKIVTSRQKLLDRDNGLTEDAEDSLKSDLNEDDLGEDDLQQSGIFSDGGQLADQIDSYLASSLKD